MICLKDAIYVARSDRAFRGRDIRKKELPALTSFKSVLANLLGALPRDIAMITDGVNKNFRVVADDLDLFARFSPSSLHTKRELDGEVELLNSLNVVGAPCCKPVSVKGQFVTGPFHIEGVEYHVLLNQTIIGDVLSPQLVDAREFGRSLAAVHQTRVEKRNASEAPRSSTVREPENISSVFQELKQLLAAQEDRNGDSLIGICHGDAWLGNAKWSGGRAILFDFEYARVGPVVYDIASFIWSLQELQDNDLQVAVYKSFVQGYRSVYDVSFDEGGLKANVLRREINNIEFLSTYIAMSGEVAVAAAELAEATCSLVTSARFSSFAWK